MRSTNKSGHTGVGWHKATGKWQANIRVEGKLLHLGLSNCITAAAVARKQADIKYSFHSNHGAPK